MPFPSYLHSLSIYQELCHTFNDDLKEEPGVVKELGNYKLVSVGRT